jgi:SAM-dependent methyltransferase
MIDFMRLSALAEDIGPSAGSTAVFWTDPHIAPILLAEHLNPETDAASRRPAAIDATVSWLETKVLMGPSRILDLGCGPGLYAERLARKGHRVRGMDFSALSVEYARERAIAAGLDIEFEVGNYVKKDFGSGWDAVMMIYCDLGALMPDDRAAVLRKARACVKPGGAFVFDVVGEDCASGFSPSRNWAVLDSGFWSAKPHVVLEESRHFPELKMIQRAALLAEEGTGRVERFMIRDWYFSDEDLRKLVTDSGFSECEFHRGFLPEMNWGGTKPVFVVARA